MADERIVAHDNAPHRGLNPRSITRVVAYIEANLGEGLTLGALADVACMSRFHFARMFRLSTGYSPMAYVLRRRVERACLQLMQGCRKVADLAAELGFCDQSHFIRIFRRMTGFTPREYARRHQPGNPPWICNLAYVASPLSSATNGAALRVDGGVIPTIGQ